MRESMKGKSKHAEQIWKIYSNFTAIFIRLNLHHYSCRTCIILAWIKAQLLEAEAYTILQPINPS